MKAIGIFAAAALVYVLSASILARGASAPAPAIQAQQEFRRDLAAAKACDGEPFAWEGPVLVCYREAR